MTKRKESESEVEETAVPVEAVAPESAPESAPEVAPSDPTLEIQSPPTDMPPAPAGLPAGGGDPSGYSNR